MTSVPVASDEAGYDAVDFQIALRSDDGECPVVGLEDKATFLGAEFFERKFVVHDSDDEVAGIGCLVPLDDDEIAIVDTVIDHGIALDRNHDRS